LQQLVYILILLCSSISQGSQTSYPAAFRTDKTRLSTLQQFESRIKELYPELSFGKKSAEPVSYKNQKFPVFTIESNGVLGSYKYEQKLTYINLHAGLWMLLYVEGKECIKGNAQKSATGEIITQWGCKNLEFPISGAFADIYLMDNESIDLEKLSKDWGKTVVVNVESEITSEKISQLTLGDIKKIIMEKGGEWSTENTTWAGSKTNPKPEQKALQIKVKVPSGTLTTYYQSFLYVFGNDNLLNLKEIDGKVCNYNEIYKKDFCEELYSPTSQTPFPMVLLNSQDLSGSKIVKNENQKESIEPKFYCGNLSENYTTALRIYFEGSIFSVQEINGYRKALAQLPIIADPQRLFVSQEMINSFSAIDEKPYALAEIVEKLKNEIEKGHQGNCDNLVPFAEDIKNAIHQHEKAVFAFINLLKASDFDEELITQKVADKDEFTKKLWSVVQMSKVPDFLQSNPKASIDVAAGFLLQYYHSALNRASNAEELFTASLVKQDAYSKLLEQTEVIATSQLLNGHAKKLYFGMRISTGSAYHYIYGLHPDTESKYDLKVGDQLISINGQEALLPMMSAVDVDNLLQNTNAAIELVVERNGVKHAVQLKARDIDIAEYFYSYDVITDKENEEYLKIRINAFEAGVAASLHENILRVLKTNNIKGIILDLQSNPGGSTDEAAAVISFFTKDKVPYYYRTGARANFSATEAILAQNELFVSETLPLVVEVDAYSASASEIVTSALKDLNRGIVVGANTFGKLVGQYFEPVQLGNKKAFAILVTATEYFTPTGRSLNGRGVSPDVTVYSSHGGIFKDGNKIGEDYVVSENLKKNIYPDFISPDDLMMIQKSIVIDNADIDEVSVRVLQKAKP
jgi:carboxyl-terminal processing protease